MPLTQISTSNLDTTNSLFFRNRIINGDMRIDQRNAGALINPAVNNTYTVDRWNTGVVQAGTYKIQQNAGSVTPPAGFTNYLGATSLTTSSLAATDNLNIRQRIEGYNIADLAWGTASAKPITISFWAQSSLTGTFSGAVTNAGLSMSYPFTYSIPVLNTWTYITVTIPGATSGTWASDNSTGMYLFFSMGAGTTLSGTAGSWSANDYRSATGSVSILSSTGVTFYITGVQLEVGTAATAFERRPYGTELQLCQRYYQTGSFAMFGYTLITEAFGGNVYFCVTKRTTPTIVYSNVVNTNNTGSYTTAIAVNQFGAYAIANGTTRQSLGLDYTASAEL
jgi:hypothetical protein